MLAVACGEVHGWGGPEVITQFSMDRAWSLVQLLLGEEEVGIYEISHFYLMLALWRLMLSLRCSSKAKSIRDIISVSSRSTAQEKCLSTCEATC